MNMTRPTPLEMVDLKSLRRPSAAAAAVIRSAASSRMPLLVVAALLACLLVTLPVALSLSSSLAPPLLFAVACLLTICGVVWACTTQLMLPVWRWHLQPRRIWPLMCEQVS